jgi:phosphoribosylformylglycinamidine cyclo-ligase
VPTYRDAGVDIEAGDALVDRIAPLARATRRDGVVAGVGGFASLFSLQGRYRDPLIVSGTDGVGTKLLLAQQLGRHDTIGIDLVAMCANDVLTTGAECLFFLDYFATGRLDVSVAEAVVAGIAEGCRRAGCALVGGETAEMPGMYAPGHYDLAGFCVGAVERDEVLDGRGIVAGDLLVGVASSGLHSNGYSLVRRILRDGGWDLGGDPAGLGRPLGDALLEPTRIYATEMAAARRFGVKGAAHVTGGGLPGNVGRCFPAGLGAVLWRRTWTVPPLMDWLRDEGGVPEDDWVATFNLGLGLVLVFDAGRAEEAAAALGGAVVGRVEAADGVRLP